MFSDSLKDLCGFCSITSSLFLVIEYIIKLTMDPDKPDGNNGGGSPSEKDGKSSVDNDEEGLDGDSQITDINTGDVSHSGGGGDAVDEVAGNFNNPRTQSRQDNSPDAAAFDGISNEQLQGIILDIEFDLEEPLPPAIDMEDAGNSGQDKEKEAVPISVIILKLEQLYPDLNETTRQKIASMIVSKMKHPNEETDLAINQSLGANSLSILVPRPNPQDALGNDVASSLSRANINSCSSPCSSLGSRKSNSNDSEKPSKKHRGSYNCGLCGGKTKKHKCQVPVSAEGGIFTGCDGRLWKIRPLNTMSDSEYESSAKKGVEKALERAKADPDKGSSDPKKRGKHKCGKCRELLVSGDSDHKCIFPDGSKFCFGDDDIPMLATPCFEPGDAASEPSSSHNVDDDDDDDDQDKKPAAKPSKDKTM